MINASPTNSAFEHVSFAKTNKILYVKYKKVAILSSPYIDQNQNIMRCSQRPFLPSLSDFYKFLISSSPGCNAGLPYVYHILKFVHVIDFE